MFKQAREKALQLLSEQENENVPALDEVAAEEIPEETAPMEELAPADVDSMPVEELEEAPDENVENLSETEAVVEEEVNDTASAEGSDRNSEGEGGIDVEAVMAENRALHEEVENLRKTLEQSAELGKAGIAAIATEDLGDVDFSAFLYGDNEAKRGAVDKLAAYVIGAVKNDAAPILAQRDEAKRALDVQKAIKVLSSMEDRFPGYGKEADAIEALIVGDKVLGAYENPIHQRVAAYLINEGIKSVKKGKAGMSLDEFMGLYRNNEEFKTAIEQERLQMLEETGDIPVIPMDGGGLSAAAPYEVPEGPKTLEEAHKLVKKMFKKG